MSAITHLDKQHLLSTNTEIKEILYRKSVIIALLSFTLAVAFYFCSTWIEDTTSGLYLATVNLSFLLVLFSIFKISYRRKRLIYAPSNSPIVSGHVYFDKSNLDVVRRMLESDSAENIEWTGFQKNGNARLDYMVSEDARFATLQFYEYVPYNYEVASPIYNYSDMFAHPIAQLLLQNHSKK